MSDLPKYASLEIERRWLVDLARCPPFEEGAGVRITDRYITGSSLRLRKIEDATEAATYKLCKKYDRMAPLAQPIVNIYLSGDEFELLDRLPGRVIVKQRHRYAAGAIDIYRSREAALAIFEVEFEELTLAQAYTPPEFVLVEVTHDPNYSGASLAGSHETGPNVLCRNPEP
jgi:CYTH domain-containing protein